jgi:hypothetical protein
MVGILSGDMGFSNIPFAVANKGNYFDELFFGATGRIE